MASSGLSGPIPVLFSTQPEETKTQLDQDPGALKTGKVKEKQENENETQNSCKTGGPEPPLPSTGPKTKNIQAKKFFCAGLRAIHKRIVDCQPLQLDQAEEMIEAPFDIEIRRPFGEETTRGGGEHKAGSSKRSAGGDLEGPHGKKTRHEPKGEKGKPDTHHSEGCR